jgi:hypothetical protein
MCSGLNRRGAWLMRASRRIVVRDRAENMSKSDLELLRLERALHRARDRLGSLTRFISDPAVLRAAEDLCAEAAAAVDAYWAAHKARRKI